MMMIIILRLAPWFEWLGFLSLVREGPVLIPARVKLYSVFPMNFMIISEHTFDVLTHPVK